MEKQYWSNYYRNGSKTSHFPPSQFAAFTVSFLDSVNGAIVDYASGNGRDSVFFANYFEEVISTDQVKGISEDQMKSYDNLTFCFPGELKRKNIKSEKCTVYARFFLHAISELEQQKFFKNIKEFLVRGEKIFLEFRTDADHDRVKCTEEHYRRFQSVDDVVNQLSVFGFKTIYTREGLGFAVYKADDAHVGRIVAERQ